MDQDQDGNKTEKHEQVEDDDMKRDLSSEFNTSPDLQQSGIEEKEHLQVYLRIRPFTSAENGSGESQDCVTIEPPDTVLLRPPSVTSARLSSDRAPPQTGQRFQFSQVYGPETTQRELFQGTVKDLVKDVLEGGNSLVFTYGVTNAGKTFTFLGPDSDAGILPRSLDVIFSSIDERVFPGMSIKPQRCREFTRLTREQEAEEMLLKRNLFRQLKEVDRSNASLLNSTNKTFLEGASMLYTAASEEVKISLELEKHSKFSVWVSFCEIYNENIHDLLEVVPSGASRRTALRLSQDVKGNAFVKDLRWVQVDSAEEAYKVMKIGKKNQSFSSTRLNQLSSRSHSIFSVRILRIEDIGTPRVHAVSELCLCDLAGSERCAKTQNKGERLKEAGNINTSLLILGKCINALRHNQQAKLLQHVPFRESKLTHYLQGFFCGRGKACMIVNINQCASMYDETLNVLKFSAVAQKIVVLAAKILPIMPSSSSGEGPSGCRVDRKTPRASRRSSLNGWESSLEDVQEDEDDNEEEESLMEVAVDQNAAENDENGIPETNQPRKEEADSLLLETRVREEVGKEFSELFDNMQNDFNDRLARETEILEERAERRLEIFKKLIVKMAVPGSSYNEQFMKTSMDPSFLEDVRKTVEALQLCVSSVKTGSRGVGEDTLEELQRKVMELNEQHNKFQKQLAHKLREEPSTRKDEEKDRLESELKKESQKIIQLEKELEDLGSPDHSMLVKERKSCERKRLQEALAALRKEMKARQDALAALEYQTVGKEEALLSLEVERKARVGALTALGDLNQRHEEVLESLKEERAAKEKAMADLEAERRAKEAAIASLEEVKKCMAGLTFNLCEERRGREESQSALEEERKEIRRLAEEKEKKEQESDKLQQEVKELTAKLEATEGQLSSETERAKQAFAQLQKAQKQLEEHNKELQEQTSQINSLNQEVKSLKQEHQSSVQSAGCDNDQLKEEVSELKKNLSEEKEKNESNRRQILDLERELAQAKEQQEHTQTIPDHQVEEFTKKLKLQEEASKLEREQLKKQLQEKEEMLLQQVEELRSRLQSEDQVVQMRAKLEEQSHASVMQIEKLTEKLQTQELTSQQQLKELEHKLTVEKTTSGTLLEELKEKLTEQEKTAERLKAELEKATVRDSNNSSAATEEDVRRLNSDLQSEVASLKSKISSMEQEFQSLCKPEAQAASTETDGDLKEEHRQADGKLAENQKASAEREGELQKQLLEKEEQVKSLQKSLREAQERREEESQAVQEARRREVERRRELLAVAHEAIAQKDEELEKKAEEINRLKDSAKQDSEKVKSLSLDLQRKEEDTSDLREKLADYKKQIQQVQKEISAMREEEKSLRQKLVDVEKAKKQLQTDLANRDRTIQQLKLEQSSDTKSSQTLEMYQNACKDLETKERVMEDMRLALTEQEETQEQMEQVLEEKLNLIQELTSEVQTLKGMILKQDKENNPRHHVDSSSDEVKSAKQETAQAQENFKLCTEKHQAERRKWLEEKLSLIGQAKEAEDKRNQEMRKFAEDRERYNRQQSQLESLTSQLAEKESSMEKWRKERDTLVAALEVQLQKLLSSQADKDKMIQQLRQNNTQAPQEDGDDSDNNLRKLQGALSEREAEMQQLKEELEALRNKQDTQTRGKINESPATLTEKPEGDTVSRTSGDRRDTRESVSSRGSAGFPSVLESSEISTENGKTSRFPRPELEISFSPLQPNRMALRRQGDENAITVKITRSARKRKSGEMDRDEVEAENRRNTRTKLTPRLTPHKEEVSSPAGRNDSQSSLRSRKEGTLQKIGDFLQSSPTLLGTKAKKMMSLVSGRVDADSAASSSSSSSLSLRAKKNKKKLYRPEISSPMDMPSHPIISREPEEKESDHQIMKRRLRSRMAK